MNCAESHELLQRRLDGEAVNEAGLGEHLLFCPGCRLQHAAAHRLLGGLEALEPPPPPDGLSRRIVARVLAERRARLARRLVLPLAAAAGLLLAVSLLARLWPPAPLPTEPPTIAQRPPEPPEVDVPELLPPPSLRDSVTEAGSAVVRATRRTADETVKQTRALLPSLPAPGLDEPAALTPAPAASASLREAGQGVSAGLEPVASSARRAVDMFLREIPPVEPESKPGL
jgi:hypothetical protein